MVAGHRVLVGWDFAFGYPAGFADAIGARGAGWRFVWRELARLIDDAPNNANNRFAVAAALNARCGPGPGPFWGCPPSKAKPSLRSTRRGTPYADRGLARLRPTDARAPGVQSVWKLDGVGSVGSQTLLGLPVVQALRTAPALAAYTRVWPFETAFADALPTGPAVVHAELWPGVVADRLDPAVPVRDQAQVRAVVDWLAEADLAARLTGPADLAPEVRAAAIAEEAWILSPA